MRDIALNFSASGGQVDFVSLQRVLALRNGRLSKISYGLAMKQAISCLLKSSKLEDP